MNLKAWSQQLTKIVFDEWKSKYSFWKEGFEMFYSPVCIHPKLMILTYNPGGDKSSFEHDLKRFESGDFSLPQENEFVTRKYRMAVKMQNFFNRHDTLLRESVTLTTLFFRSKNTKVWTKCPKQSRKEMESFCYKKVNEIIEVLQPLALLILGFKTYVNLKRHLFDRIDYETKTVGYNGNTICYIGKWNNKPLFCIPHPTGSRIKKDDWEKIKKRFYEFSYQLND